MKIQSVFIENFRCIERAEIDLADVTTFLGRNGAGKSTVLYALESFYNVGAQQTEHDYYNHESDRTIRLRLTYGDLQEDELTEFGGYVRDGKLAVTKVINSGGARYYGTTDQIPRFAELRRLAPRDRRTALKADVDAGQFPDFGTVPTRGEDLETAMENYESRHRELLRPMEHETQFFGPKNVGGGKLDKFTKFVLVPAVRDAGAELDRRGAIMQLLDLVVLRSISTRRDFLQFKEEFEQRAKDLYGRSNLPELSELGRLVTEKLARYAPGSELDIDFAELKPPTIPLPEAVVSVSEDDFKVPIRYSGHGLQRALILALLEQLSRTSTAAAQEEPTKDGAKQPNLILAIEEPELYLHPARSRYLASILRELAEVTQGGALTQIVTVTHSPYFVDVGHFDEIRMCRKLPAAARGLPRSTGFSSFTRAEAAQRLAALSGRPAESFSPATFVARAAPVLNSIVNEGLFADVAVVVEGDSDVAALWAAQAHLGKRWDELGVVVVPAAGKSKIDRIVVAFQGFEIPTYFMFDGDRRKGEGADVNRRLLRLGRLTEVDFPDCQVTQTLTAFEDDLETYLASVVGDRFEEIRNRCADDFGHDRPSTALKNSEIMSEFLAVAAQMGYSFEVLERAVDTITQLALALQRPPEGKGTGKARRLPIAEFQGKEGPEGVVA